MPNFLILKLNGVMQAWGDHTYEDYRPTIGFPTRSGLLGLIAACLGMERNDYTALQDLSNSVLFTIRVDKKVINNLQFELVKLTDYHTIKDARNVDGTPNTKNAVVSKRDYLFDAIFTLAIESTKQPVKSLKDISNAIKKPIYTPFLGRRSCPLCQPLLLKDNESEIEASNALDALGKIAPQGGIVYTESPALMNDKQIRLRDVPIYGRFRKFTTREVFIHAGKEVQNVPK